MLRRICCRCFDHPAAPCEPARDSVDQPTGIGMSWVREDICDQPALDDATGEHHDHPPAQRFDEAKVVRDDNERQLLLGLQGLQ